MPSGVITSPYEEVFLPSGFIIKFVSFQRDMEEQPLIKVQSRIGSLHTVEVYKKFKEAGASPLVLNILANGVPLYFFDLKIRKYPRGKQCNNQSALAQQEFVSKTLQEWEQKDYVRRIPLEEARVILPVSVADRWSHTKKKLKYRLVLDCSPLTRNMAYGKIKLPDLNYLRHQIKKGDLLSLIDITSFYLHFTLDSKCLLSLSVLVNYFL